ncbi:hypothetical protein [Thalassovita mediterranea]|jgi:hypothetical protein|uniref:hypothetical protein n=1 Tax=Thalassovita mediterranea TaxID=340021 RepID=UPI00118021E3|nr:hypothetical protein [Thalassovita mediterranea]MCG7572873.1 hypothetical protein [Phaeobacter sp. CNT1-3]
MAMNLNIFRKRTPLRVRSVKELDPKFKPRWVKIELGLLAAMAGACGCVVVAAILQIGWLAMIAFYGLPTLFAAVFAVKYGTVGLGFIGVWFPILALKAAQLERWLELDLDWKR